MTRILIFLCLLFPVVAFAQPLDTGLADAGSLSTTLSDAGSASAPSGGHPYRDAGLAPLVDETPAPQVTIHAPDDLARNIYRGVTSKDWFLVAGAALSLLVLGVRWLLAKRWPTVESEIWGVALVAVIAGLGGLGNAWLADERLASSVTLLGALKVWAAAVFAYVTTRKLLKAKGPAGA